MAQHPRWHAAIDPRKPVLVFADRGDCLTYGELSRRSDRVSGLLAAHGIEQGETIAVLLENHIRYPEILWGAKNSGVRYVCVSTHLNAADAAYVISDSGARLLFTSRQQANLVQDAIKALTRPLPVLMLDGATAPFDPYEDHLEQVVPLVPQGRRRGPSMLYSSGTTGRPKGVKTPLPAASPEEPPQRFAMLQQQYGFSADTVFLNPGPFYHAAPNRFMMSVMRAGGTVIGFSQFDASKVLDAIGRYRATHGFFVPTMFTRLLGLPPTEKARAETGTMRHAIHAAAPCPVAVKREMINWWGPVVDELYAGTEAFGHTFINSAEWLDHPGSVGRPPENCDLKIVDEDGNRLEPFQPGRIMMRNGLHVEYHGDELKTAALYDGEGFASLGDIGYVDNDGYVYLTDRESHMIIAGGVNIYPQEAENVLIDHPDIADVAVIGIPDDDMGEAVHGIVELVPGVIADDSKANEIIAYCRERLSRHKCPRTIDFVESLPRNPMGKLRKGDLRKRYWPENR